MARHRTYMIRNLDDESYLETFWVAAIAAILSIRFYLYVTGFPQVGGKGLHVAHMLWGGLLMVIGLAILFNYLDRDAYRAAALVGGAGFGLFLDELGKFITSDNNYFFRPTASIIYIVFVLLYLVFRLLEKERNVTDSEYFVNSLQMFEQSVIRGYDRSYLARARLYLHRAGRDTPMAEELSRLYDACPLPLPQDISRLQRWREASRTLYRRLTETSWFPRAVVAFFLVEAVVTLAIAIASTVLITGFVLPGDPGSTQGSRSLIRESDLVFAVLATGLVLAGVAMMVRSRVDAYRLFKYGMLVSVFLTQVFEFYVIQFTALFGLAFNIVGLILVNIMLARERDRTRSRRADPVSSLG